MKIRPYKHDDYGLLVTTIDSVCAEGKWMHTQQFIPTEAWMHALEHPNSGNQWLFVAEVYGSIIGWCRAFRDDTDSSQAEIGIGVAEPYRNQGIGTRLLLEIQKLTQFQGVRQLYLSTRVDNERAIHLFRKLGFDVYGHHFNGYLTFTKPLSSDFVFEEAHL